MIAVRPAAREVGPRSVFQFTSLRWSAIRVHSQIYGARLGETAGCLGTHRPSANGTKVKLISRVIRHGLNVSYLFTRQAALRAQALWVQSEFFSPVRHFFISLRITHLIWERPDWVRKWPVPDAHHRCEDPSGSKEKMAVAGASA